jgi:hypothetical protein
MPRIDMTTREWHELIKPVLAHAVSAKDLPELGHVRIEAGNLALYAVATDRYTLGAERRVFERREQYQPMPPVHVRATDAAASLKLFPFSKDEDPPLKVTIDEVRVPAEVMGHEGLYSSLGITLDGADGGRLVMHDRRVPDRDHLAHWRLLLRSAMRRNPGTALEGLALGAAYVGRWKDAVRAGEVMRLYTGPKATDAILITVERHFAGLWVPVSHIETRSVASLPWLEELPDESGLLPGIDVDTETGEKLNPEGGEHEDAAGAP